MGNRVVVTLYTDQCDEWANDPLLGQKIHQKMHFTSGASNTPYKNHLGYGNVELVNHMDTQMLMLFDGCQGEPLITQQYIHNEADDYRNKRLLIALANKFGCTVRLRGSQKDLN